MADGDKIVLVTGASSGFGKACSDLLSRSGFITYAASRSLTSGGDGPRRTVTLDVNGDDSVRACIERIRDEAGRLDAVVNCAGYGISGAVEEASIDEAKALFETNFFGMLRVCRAVLPIMRDQGEGWIVNVSSLAGRIGLPFQGLYSATKYAIEGLTEALRMEVKPFGVRVCVVEPGDFNTGFTGNRQGVAGPMDVYAGRSKTALAAAERDEMGGAAPDLFARLILRILQDSSPRLRYTVGSLSQRLSTMAKPLLPQRFFERELLKHYDVG